MRDFDDMESLDELSTDEGVARMVMEAPKRAFNFNV